MNNGLRKSYEYYGFMKIRFSELFVFEAVKTYKNKQLILVLGSVEWKIIMI